MKIVVSLTVHAVVEAVSLSAATHKAWVERATLLAQAKAIDVTSAVAIREQK